jgi:hypothetical protein
MSSGRRSRLSSGANGTLASGQMTVRERKQGTSSAMQAREVIDMAIALGVIAIAACCALCAWGLATALRPSRKRHAPTVRH